MVNQYLTILFSLLLSSSRGALSRKVVDAGASSRRNKARFTFLVFISRSFGLRELRRPHTARFVQTRARARAHTDVQTVVKETRFPPHFHPIVFRREPQKATRSFVQNARGFNSAVLLFRF